MVNVLTENSLSGVFGWARQLVGADHPMRLGVGTMIGIVAFSIKAGAVAIWPDHLIVKFCDAAGFMLFIPGGILITFMPLLWQKRLPEDNQKWLDTLDTIAERGGFDQKYKKRLYDKFAENLLAKYNQKRSVEIQHALSEATGEITKEAVSHRKADHRKSIQKNEANTAQADMRDGDETPEDSNMR
jgi:hypothetical protein